MKDKVVTKCKIQTVTTISESNYKILKWWKRSQADFKHLIHVWQVALPRCRGQCLVEDGKKVVLFGTCLGERVKTKDQRLSKLVCCCCCLV